jgi:hypothetical protein
LRPEQTLERDLSYFDYSNYDPSARIEAWDALDSMDLNIHPKAPTQVTCAHCQRSRGCNNLVTTAQGPFVQGSRVLYISPRLRQRFTFPFFPELRHIWLRHPAERAYSAINRTRAKPRLPS